MLLFVGSAFKFGLRLWCSPKGLQLDCFGRFSTSDDSVLLFSFRTFEGKDKLMKSNGLADLNSKGLSCCVTGMAWSEKSPLKKAWSSSVPGWWFWVLLLTKSQPLLLDWKDAWLSSKFFCGCLTYEAKLGISMGWLFGGFLTEESVTASLLLPARSISLSSKSILSLIPFCYKLLEPVPRHSGSYLQVAESKQSYISYWEFHKHRQDEGLG